MEPPWLETVCLWEAEAEDMEERIIFSPPCPFIFTNRAIIRNGTPKSLMEA